MAAGYTIIQQEGSEMELIKKLQCGSLGLAALVFAIAVLTGLHILPNLMLRLTVGGLHRVADTLLFFSLALGLWRFLEKK